MNTLSIHLLMSPTRCTAGKKLKPAANGRRLIINCSPLMFFDRSRFHSVAVLMKLESKFLKVQLNGPLLKRYPRAHSMHEFKIIFKPPFYPKTCMFFLGREFDWNWWWKSAVFPYSCWWIYLSQELFHRNSTAPTALLPCELQSSFPHALICWWCGSSLQVQAYTILITETRQNCNLLVMYKLL